MKTFSINGLDAIFPLSEQQAETWRVSCFSGHFAAEASNPESDILYPMDSSSVTSGNGSVATPQPSGRDLVGIFRLEMRKAVTSKISRQSTRAI
jgi:hypothetical protein